MSLFEKSWFKWTFVGSTTFISVFVCVFLVMQKTLEVKRIEEAEEARRHEELNREYKFNTAMTRIRQNLELSHFLAAHKNLERLPRPNLKNPVQVKEYLDVLNRVGQGLLRNNFLLEAEQIFHEIKEFRLGSPEATEALSRIDSKRMLSSATLHLEQGLDLISQKEYRAAQIELDKAKREFEAVAAKHFDDVRAYLKELSEPYAEATYHVRVEDAWEAIDEAESFMLANQFMEAQAMMSRAANLTGRAAFLRPNRPEIQKLRDRLVAMDEELLFRAPNIIPIWNRYAETKSPGVDHHFHMYSYELEPEEDENHFIKVGLTFNAHTIDEFFVVRYRIHFFSGHSIFNGHFLLPGQDFEPGEKTSILYAQEIPEAFHGKPIQRVDLRVYNHEDIMVSTVTRAFKRPG